MSFACPISSHPLQADAQGPTEAVTILSDSIPGQLQYLRSKPYALLFRPPPEADPRQLGPGAAGARGPDDLATFLLPRILRAAASLDAALLQATEPDGEDRSAQAQLHRDRRTLARRLEDLLATVVRVLAESAVRVEWAPRPSAVPGGLGKAREMMAEMVKLLRSASQCPRLRVRQ